MQETSIDMYPESELQEKGSWKSSTVAELHQICWDHVSFCSIFFQLSSEKFASGWLLKFKGIDR